VAVLDILKMPPALLLAMANKEKGIYVLEEYVD
jgi:hypothetical protein